MLQMDLEIIQSEELQLYDQMMIEVIIKFKDVPVMAIVIWRDVLKELSARNLVSLISGTFDNIGDALIVRNYIPQS